MTDTCVKNGGDLFLQEIASREFVDNLVSILKMPTLNLDVKTKILRLIQNWALAFEGKPALAYVSEVYRSLQREGVSFGSGACNASECCGKALRSPLETLLRRVLPW